MSHDLRHEYRPWLKTYDATFVWHHYLPDARYEEFVRPWSDRAEWRGR